MKKEVDLFIKACWECQAKTEAPQDQCHTYCPIVEGYPFQKVSLDFVGPLQPSRQGRQFILTVKDVFTRWLEAFPLCSANAEAVVGILKKEIFSRYGIPDVVHSDQGMQFTSHLFQAVGELLGIRITNTPTYNPKSNLVE